MQVLVMHGETDPICEAADAAKLSRHIAGSQLLEVPGADHWYKGKQQQLLEAVGAFVVQAGREKNLCSC
jgi:alpha/beta superfamily hydrolase